MSVSNKEKVYGVWAGMMARCYDPEHQANKYYRSKGVVVCDRWHDYHNFYEDMLSTYKVGLTLERIDNRANYSPENCRWATWEEQANNKSNNRLIEFDGLKMTFARWSKKLGIKLSTLQMRFYRYGWSVERCLTTPARKVRVVH